VNTRGSLKILPARAGRTLAAAMRAAFGAGQPAGPVITRPSASVYWISTWRDRSTDCGPAERRASGRLPRTAGAGTATAQVVSPWRRSRRTRRIPARPASAARPPTSANQTAIRTGISTSGWPEMHQAGSPGQRCGDEQDHARQRGHGSHTTTVSRDEPRCHAGTGPPRAARGRMIRFRAFLGSARGGRRHDWCQWGIRPDSQRLARASRLTPRLCPRRLSCSRYCRHGDFPHSLNVHCLAGQRHRGACHANSAEPRVPG
jgi:hypothetical protein